MKFVLETKPNERSVATIKSNDAMTDNQATYLVSCKFEGYQRLGQGLAYRENCKSYLEVLCVTETELQIHGEVSYRVILNAEYQVNVLIVKFLANYLTLRFQGGFGAVCNLQMGFRAVVQPYSSSTDTRGHIPDREQPGGHLPKDSSPTGQLPDLKTTHGHTASRHYPNQTYAQQDKGPNRHQSDPRIAQSICFYSTPQYFTHACPELRGS